MKKIVFIFSIVVGLLFSHSTQIFAGCNIVWSGSAVIPDEDTGYPITYPVSGSVSTDETSRTEQAAKELFSYLPGTSCGTPNFTDSCYGSSWYMQTGPHSYSLCDKKACIPGSWWFQNVCTSSPGCMYINSDGSGTWDVICESTLIQLSSFTVTPKAGKISIQWSTESEIDNAGFNIYRSESEEGEYSKINNSFIPAKGLAAQGAQYEYFDTDVQNRKTYWYKLEDMDVNGTGTFHGPVSATPRMIYGLER